MNARAARLGMQALALVGVIGLLALLVWKLTHDPGGGVAAQLSQGKRPTAPDFTLSRLDGRGSVELASIKKPRVVDFFASWCYTCPTYSKRLEKYSREYGGRIAFIGVNSLVDDYGQEILASPPKHGFNLLAWLLPLVGIVAAGAVLGVAAWRWTRGRAEPGPLSAHSVNGQGPVDAELDRRVDEELARFE